MKYNPRVSVIVPTFNVTEDVLEKSLSSLMVQTFKDFECIVVDESTVPEFAKACQKICDRDARFRYVRPNERLGLAGSLNLAISLAQGALLARFDSDDICIPTRLELQVAYLDKYIDIGVVGSWMQIIDRFDNPVSIRKYEVDPEKIIQKFIYTNSIGHPSVMFRKSLIIGLDGPYRSDFKYSEDLELWLRLIGKGVRFSNIPDCLVLYRQDDTYRASSNWKFNIKARIINISSPNFLFKSMVIVGLFVWMLLPKAAHKIIYKWTVLD
jgi:glycosyltransferase involved in cell wall biosynthesis